MGAFDRYAAPLASPRYSGPSNTSPVLRTHTGGQTGFLHKGWWPFRHTIEIKDWKIDWWHFYGSYPDDTATISGDIWTEEPLAVRTYRATLVTKDREIITCKLAITDVYLTGPYAKFVVHGKYRKHHPDTLDTILRPTR